MNIMVLCIFAVLITGAFLLAMGNDIWMQGHEVRVCVWGGHMNIKGNDIWMQGHEVRVCVWGGT